MPTIMKPANATPAVVKLITSSSVSYIGLVTSCSVESNLQEAASSISIVGLLGESCELHIEVRIQAKEKKWKRGVV